jgi:uncharacterized membrane protein YqaE (UPF0057 family)
MGPLDSEDQEHCEHWIVLALYHRRRNPHHKADGMAGVFVLSLRHLIRDASDLAGRRDGRKRYCGEPADLLRDSLRTVRAFPKGWAFLACSGILFPPVLVSIAKGDHNSDLVCAIKRLFLLPYLSPS